VSGSPQAEQHTVGTVARPQPEWLNSAGTPASPAVQRVARLFRLFPDARFTVDDVVVQGWPWATRAVALVPVDRPGGYRNEVARTIDLRRGRITRITTLEDTKKLSDVLAALAARGVDEAARPTHHRRGRGGPGLIALGAPAAPRGGGGVTGARAGAWWEPRPRRG
jgi:ketosteroid isomerase-like protein